MRHILTVLFMSVLLFYSEASASINVVPEPNSIVAGQGHFLLSRSTAIVRAKSLEKLGGYLSEQLGIFTRLRPRETVSAKRGKNTLTLN